MSDKTVRSFRVSENIPASTSLTWSSVSPPANSAHSGKSNGAIPLKVISYNVLSDGIRGAMSCKHNYCSEELRVWKDSHYSNSRYSATQRNLRLHRVVQRLLELDADIICLQEAGKEFLHDFMSMEEISLIYDDIKRSVQFSDLYSGYHVADFLREEDETKIDRPDEMDNLILVRNELIKDGTIEVIKVQSFLYKNNLTKGRHTGKNKKRLSSLEETSMFMRLVVNIPLPEEICDTTYTTTTNNNDCISKSHVTKKVPLLIGNTHLFWDPRYPQVKASQAELFVNLGAQEAHNFVRENDFDDDHVNIIFCGDFNTVCNFQPRFCFDVEKGDSVSSINGDTPLPLLSEDTFRQLSIPPGIDAARPTGEAHNIYCFFPKLQPDSSSLVTTPNIHSLPQCVLSGGFQLYACGTLPSCHPEHPDSFRKTPQQLEQRNNCKKKSNGMGSMFLATGPLIHAYSSYPLVITTKVPEFEGWIDHLWYSTYNVSKLPHESASNSSSKEDQEQGKRISKGKKTSVKKQENDACRISSSLVSEITITSISSSLVGEKDSHTSMTQTGYLKIVDEDSSYLPNSREPSDHLPVGASFVLSVL